jgi:hypothetical protein
MNQSPIYTVVKNNSNVDRTIRWTGEAPIWIGAGATVEIPYEAWSKADRNKRTSMIADLQSGATSVSLKVLQADGSYLAVPYSVPTIMTSKCRGTATVTVKDKALAFNEDDSRHNIKVKSGDAEKAAEHYGATKAAEEPVTGTRIEGASTDGFQKDTDTLVKSTRETIAESEARMKAEEEETAEKESQAVESDTGKPVDDDKDDEKNDTQDSASDGDDDDKEAELPEDAARKIFAESIAAKNWEGARGVMCTYFGEDKVTFSAKTVSAMKDWDAIVAKYKLA